MFGDETVNINITPTLIRYEDDSLGLHNIGTQGSYILLQTKGDSAGIFYDSHYSKTENHENRGVLLANYGLTYGSLKSLYIQNPMPDNTNTPSNGDAFSPEALEDDRYDLDDILLPKFKINFERGDTSTINVRVSCGEKPPFPDEADYTSFKSVPYKDIDGGLAPFNTGLSCDLSTYYSDGRAIKLTVAKVIYDSRGCIQLDFIETPRSGTHSFKKSYIIPLKISLDTVAELRKLVLESDTDTEVDLGKNSTILEKVASTFAFNVNTDK